MIENRGPEARLADFAADALLTVERLPNAVAEIERAARAVSDGTIRFDTGRARQRAWLWAVPVALVAFLLGLAIG